MGGSEGGCCLVGTPKRFRLNSSVAAVDCTKLSEFLEEVSDDLVVMQPSKLEGVMEVKLLVTIDLG